MVQAGETTTPKILLHELAQSAPQYEETVMTIAERLREEAWQEGFQEGFQEVFLEGIEKCIAIGIHEGVLQVARKMLASGFTQQTVMQLSGLTEQELDQLRH